VSGPTAVNSRQLCRSPRCRQAPHAERVIGRFMSARRRTALTAFPVGRAPRLRGRFACLAMATFPTRPQAHRSDAGCLTKTELLILVRHPLNIVDEIHSLADCVRRNDIGYGTRSSKATAYWPFQGMARARMTFLRGLSRIAGTCPILLRSSNKEKPRLVPMLGL